MSINQNFALRFPKRRAILSPLRRSFRKLTTLNTSPAENVPFREVNSSPGTAFKALQGLCKRGRRIFYRGERRFVR
jgi:hypothetical protein